MWGSQLNWHNLSIQIHMSYASYGAHYGLAVAMAARRLIAYMKTVTIEKEIP